jgi:hypothetical protein
MEATSNMNPMINISDDAMVYYYFKSEYSIEVTSEEIASMIAVMNDVDKRMDDIVAAKKAICANHRVQYGDTSSSTRRNKIPCMVMETFTEAHAIAVVRLLLDLSTPFKSVPLPGGHWEFTYKKEVHGRVEMVTTNPEMQKYRETMSSDLL